MDILNKIYKPKSELYRRTDYTKHILTVGLLKSVTETTFISSGVGLLLFYFAQPKAYCWYTPLIAVGIGALGVLIDYTGDKVKMKFQDKKDLETERFIKEQVKDSELRIQGKSQEVAEELIMKKLIEFNEDCK